MDSGWRLDNRPDTGDGDPYDSRAAALRTFSEGDTLLIKTTDNPGAGWGPDAADASKHDDRFQMYVVYFVGHPRTPTFQRRLGSLSWSWKGEVVYDIAAFNPASSTSVPYRFVLPRQHPQAKPIPMDPVVSTTSYQGLNSDIGPFRQCPLGPPPVTNQIDGSRFFVDQHYKDFLNRASDRPGSNFWTSNITPCGFDTSCIERKRVDVARAFFYAEEFISQVPGLAGGTRGTDSYNREFVRQCYYRYLRRTCDPAVCDSAGFNFWVNKLNSQWPTIGEGAYNEMLRAFILSIEYRRRFGPA